MHVSTYRTQSVGADRKGHRGRVQWVPGRRETRRVVGEQLGSRCPFGCESHRRQLVLNVGSLLVGRFTIIKSEQHEPRLHQGSRAWELVTSTAAGVGCRYSLNVAGSTVKLWLPRRALLFALDTAEDCTMDNGTDPSFFPMSWFWTIVSLHLPPTGHTPVQHQLRPFRRKACTPPTVTYHRTPTPSATMPPFTTLV